MPDHMNYIQSDFHNENETLTDWRQSHAAPKGPSLAERLMNWLGLSVMSDDQYEAVMNHLRDVAKGAG